MTSPPKLTALDVVDVALLRESLARMRFAEDAGNEPQAAMRRAFFAAQWVKSAPAILDWIEAAVPLLRAASSMAEHVKLGQDDQECFRIERPIEALLAGFPEGG